MLDTGIRQLRMARSLIWGLPISPDNVRRLVDHVHARSGADS